MTKFNHSAKNVEVLEANLAIQGPHLRIHGPLKIAQRLTQWIMHKWNVSSKSDTGEQADLCNSWFVIAINHEYADTSSIKTLQNHL